MNNEYQFYNYQREVVATPPSFAETVGNTIGLTFAPIFDTIGNGFRYGARRQEGYDPTKEVLPGYEMFAGDILETNSKEHAAAVRAMIDRSIQRRVELGEASLPAQFAAEFLNPVNAVAIPVGGLASGFARAFGRGALAAGASQAAIEVGLAQPFDPVATAQESAMNIATTMIFGGALGGISAAPGAVKTTAYTKMKEQLDQFYDVVRRNENASGITPDLYLSRQPREERPLGQMSEEELQANAARLEAQAKQINDQSEGPEVNDEVNALNGDARQYRLELGLRTLEDSNINIDDPLRILPNWFTDSPLYKMVPTPMKSALQSEWPTTVKRKFINLANDGGIALLANSLGEAVSPSVHQLVGTRFARFAVSNTKMRELWAADTNASPRAILDISPENLQRKLSRSPDTFEKWVDMVSRKRLLGATDMTENELKAAAIIEDYFVESQKRLEEQGLIATKAGLQKRIQIIQTEMDMLQQRLDRAKPGSRQAKTIEARMKQMRKSMDGYTRSLMDDEMRLVEYEKAVEDILDWNQTWMAGEREKLVTKLEKIEPTLRSLQETYETRGLTQKQQKLFDDLTEQVANAQEILDRYNGLDQRIRAAKNIDDLFALIDELDTTARMDEALRNLKRVTDRARTRLESARNRINESPTPKAEPFFPRFFDKQKIKAQRDKFRNILVNWFRENPYVYVWDTEIGDYVLQKLSVDPAELRKRADDTIKRIMQESDQPDLDNVFFGIGRSKHFRSRQLDIPNKLVLDFIVTNPSAAMHTYAARIEPRYYFGRIFGTDYDGVLAEMELDMLDDGKSELEINKARKEFDVLYRRIVGNIYDRPDRLSNKIATLLTNGASFAYMGGAGFPAIADAGRIIMQNEMRPMLKSVMSLADKNFRRASIREMEFAGQLFENIHGATYARIFEDQASNVQGNKLLNTARNAFYNLNGLTPVTYIMKYFAGVTQSHYIIEKSIAWSKGSIPEQDKRMLAQLGIDEDFAKKIAKAPWETSKDGMYYANTEDWADQELVERYRTALSSGMLNQVINGTPADKPSVVDGVVYVPMNIAGKFGLKEDARVKGYARVENALLALPFQFYNFLFGALNKTTAAMAHGQVKNRALGAATMFGLAYMITSARTPDYIWDEMDIEDKMARALDMSGLLSIYSDLFYTSLHTSIAFGGPNITGGFIDPKYRQEKSLLDGVVGLAGAGPSWAADVAAGVYEFTSGNYGEGAKMIVREAPGSNLWFLKDQVNETTRGWGN